eukprot:8650120-Prorocentrum_lima.AAC.1
MTSSLVGSEMCIRDRSRWTRARGSIDCAGSRVEQNRTPHHTTPHHTTACLLYTSDAADDM